MTDNPIGDALDTANAEANRRINEMLAGIRTSIDEVLAENEAFRGAGRGLSLAVLTDRLRTVHDGLFLSWCRERDKGNRDLYYGRAQGVELAAKAIGVTLGVPICDRVVGLAHG